MTVELHWLTALRAEAAPLIEHYGLARRSGPGSLAVYERDDMRLIISGIGKFAAANAVGYLAAACQNDSAAWLNLGIAGHRELALGTMRYIDIINEAATGNSLYPALVFKSQCAGAALCTVDQPETTFADDALYDMEGYGYFAAATKFASVERVQLLKIVSDNGAADINKIDRRSIAEMITTNLDAIDAFVVAYREALARDDAAYLSATQNIIDSFTLTASQQVLVREGIRRLYALDAAPIVSDIAASACDGSALLEAMNRALKNTRLKLGDRDD